MKAGSIPVPCSKRPAFGPVFFWGRVQESKRAQIGISLLLDREEDWGYNEKKRRFRRLNAVDKKKMVRILSLVLVACLVLGLVATAVTMLIG